MKFDQLKCSDLNSAQLLVTCGGKKKRNVFHSCTWQIMNGIKNGSKLGPWGSAVGAGIGYFNCSEITAH